MSIKHSYDSPHFASLEEQITTKCTNCADNPKYHKLKFDSLCIAQLFQTEEKIYS